MRETSLWKWLKTASERLGPDALHMTRIENSTKSGTPDVEGHLCGVGQFWLELKVGVLSKGGAAGVKLRPGQAPWLDARWRAGGAALLLVQLTPRWGSEGGDKWPSYASPTLRILVPGYRAELVTPKTTATELLELSATSRDFCRQAKSEEIVEAAASIRRRRAFS